MTALHSLRIQDAAHSLHGPIFNEKALIEVLQQGKSVADRLSRFPSISPKRSGSDEWVRLRESHDPLKKSLFFCKS